MENVSRRPAVSTIAVVVAVVALIAIAAGAYIFLVPGGTKPTTSSTTTSGNTVSISMILNGQTSAGFYKNSLVTFQYTKDFTCTPALSKFASNQTEANLAAAKTSCEVGGGNSTAVAHSAPVFILVPAFAGLSIFGVPALGATSQGYPTFNGQLIFTQCGAGGTTAACSDHPTLIYSPYFTAVEQHLGIMGGLPASLGGPLPEGVLPTPAHDHVVNYVGGSSIPWDVITVLVRPECHARRRDWTVPPVGHLRPIEPDSQLPHFIRCTGKGYDDLDQRNSERQQDTERPNLQHSLRRVRLGGCEEPGTDPWRPDCH